MLGMKRKRVERFKLVEPTQETWHELGQANIATGCMANERVLTRAELMRAKESGGCFPFWATWKSKRNRARYQAIVMRFDGVLCWIESVNGPIGVYPQELHVPADFDIFETKGGD